MPLYIVSNRDPLFTTMFWQIVVTRIGATIHMSSTYYPATNGHT